MPPFPKPTFSYAYTLSPQIKALNTHKLTRGIPDKAQKKLLILTWNIANLGQQERRDDDLDIIAHIMSWFDVIAVQECKENFGHLFDIQKKLGSNYAVICSDASGNNERLAFLYDTTKITLLEEIGEIAFPPSLYKNVKLPGNAAKFDGFDRTPYLASFKLGKSSIVLVNVHLFFGSDAPADMARRALETFAVAKWADTRKKSKFSFTLELAAMGDVNMPMSVPGDPIFDALTRLGLEIPDHSSQIASSIMSDAKYDQVAFFAGTTQNCFTGRKGVFDYDQVVFRDLFGGGSASEMAKFKAYCRYYISDHRPMWVELSTP
jgi:endonuclease/exonuclease/phosphatase family metal-dependent hydrolase